MTTLQEAYDMIDRVLRNTLYEDDYAEHLAALDLVSSPALAQQSEQQPVAWMTRYGNVARADAIKSGIPFDDREDYTVPLYTAAPTPQPPDVKTWCGYIAAMKEKK